MSQDPQLVLCYNRGCGKKYDPKDNKQDDCIYHPGVPVFHDTYKIWSCCNKKCTDFTEFLNVKGCTKSCHSNVKPVEPKKPEVDKTKSNEHIEVTVKPINNVSSMERPPFDSPQRTLVPSISPALLEQIKDLMKSESKVVTDGTVQIGENCKNNACKATYAGSPSDDEVCNHHPGVAIFHEGMKYWSCCQKRTTDFSTFLEQAGCTQGKHNWSPKDTGKKVQCRYDWHQTGTFVVISIYAKKYQPKQSSVKLNPIRLTVDLFFIEENSNFLLDLELRGIVDVNQSSVRMLPTKVEIELRKAEPGSWSKLNFPRTKLEDTVTPQDTDKSDNSVQIDTVDLSDL